MLYGSLLLADDSATTFRGPVGFFKDDFSGTIFFTISTGICSKYVVARGLTDFLFMTH